MSGKDEDMSSAAVDEETKLLGEYSSALMISNAPANDDNNNSDNDDSRAYAMPDHQPQRQSKLRKFRKYLPFPPGGVGKKAKQRPTLTRSSVGESLTQIYSSVSGSVSHGLDVIKEDVEVAAEEMREAFVSELQQADRGDTYFLETNLTRALSVLPEELGEFVEEATGIEVVLGEEHDFKSDIEHPSVEVVGKSALSAVGPFLSLLSAVVAVSSNGSALSLLRGVSPPLKLYWRMTATAAVLSIFAVRTLMKLDGRPKLSRSQWLTFAAAVICFSFQCLLFVLALSFTSIGNAVIYANSQAVLLLLGKACVGEQVVLMEGCGALLAFIGAMLCSSDSEGSSEEGEHALWGDGLAFLSAVFGVGYLTFAKAVRSHMSVTVFMFLVMLCGSFLVLLFMMCSDIEISFSANPYDGLFGWLSWRPDRLLVAIWIVFVCNMVGTMGFLRAMQHFDNIIIAVATLLEPMVASFIAYELHVGVLPGTLGWIGNAAVMLGTLGVVYPSVNSGGGAH